MFLFVHVQDIKTVHKGGGDRNWQNSVNVVVKRPLTGFLLLQGKAVVIVGKPCTHPTLFGCCSVKAKDLRVIFAPLDL